MKRLLRNLLLSTTVTASLVPLGTSAAPILDISFPSPLYAGQEVLFGTTITMPPGEVLWDYALTWSLQGPNGFALAGGLGEYPIILPEPGTYLAQIWGWTTYTHPSVIGTRLRVVIGTGWEETFTAEAPPAAALLAVPGPGPSGLPLAGLLYFLWRRKNAY